MYGKNNKNDSSFTAAGSLRMYTAGSGNANGWDRPWGNTYHTYRLSSTVSGADTVFYLYDENGNQVAYNDDGGEGLASMLYFTPSSAGYYYLKVYSYGGTIGSGKNYTATMTRGNKMKKWTMLVYMCADNNLAGAAETDVGEMEAIGSSDDVNVVLLWDDKNARHGYYYVSQGSTTLLQDLGEVDMGSETTANPGWDYDFLQPLVNNPNMNARNLAQEMFNSYTDFYKNYKARTFSVFNLSEINSIDYALDDFCNAAMASGTPAATFKSNKSSVL